MNIINAALEQLMFESERIRDYLQNNVACPGIDIPDEVLIPFFAAIAFAEKASTTINKQCDGAIPHCNHCKRRASGCVRTLKNYSCFERFAHV